MPSGCNPNDLIVTAEHTLLLADAGNDKIYELDENGSSIRNFGSAGSGNSQFNDPTELVIGPSNRLFVTDKLNHRVQILERNGTFVKAFGTSGSGDGQFNQPWGIAVINNEIFVSDMANNRVQVFDQNGTFIRKWGSLGNLDGQLNSPRSITAISGKIYVSDYTNKRTCIFSKNGEFLKKFNFSHAFGGNNIVLLNRLSSGLLGTSGESNAWKQDNLYLREYDGSLVKTHNFGKSGMYSNHWSPFAQFNDGTLVYAHRSQLKLVFLKQTYRAHRKTPSKDAPFPEVISVTQPAGTNHLEVKYRITDADSAKVKAGLLAFKDGGNDLTKVIVPKTFVGSVAGKLDENTTTGVVHTVTWDAKADWNVSYGNVELAVVAQDDRDLMNFHFLTLPGTETNSTELKISRSPILQTDFLNAWYILLALGDPGITLEDGRVRIIGSSLATGVSGTGTNDNGIAYLFDKMNLRAGNHCRGYPS